MSTAEGRLAPSAVLAAAAVALAAVVVMVTPETLARVAAISTAAIVLFATRTLPEPVTAAATFLAFLAVGAAPTEVIFSGFATGGFWLLFAGLVMGSAIATTGLGRQVALRLFVHTGQSYARAVWILSFAGLGLGLLVPSAIPRVIVMMPIAMALAEAMGFKPGSRGHVGLTITAATMTLMPTYAFLTANLPTIVQFGAMEAVYGYQPTWTGYFVYQLPMNVIRFAILVALLLPLARGAVAEGAAAVEGPSPLNGAQKRLLALLGVAILLWVTDFVHGIAPAWIALAAAAVLLWPAAGIMDKTAMKSQIDLSPAFFIAAVFAVSAVAAHTGLSQAVADALIPRLGLGEAGTLRDLVAITGFSTFISHLTTAPATPVVLVPLAEPIATAAGWSLEAVSMTQVFGIATTILPYQAPPLILAIALAAIPAGPLTRICVLLSIGSLAVGLPVSWLWWEFLGYL